MNRSIDCERALHCTLHPSQRSLRDLGRAIGDLLGPTNNPTIPTLSTQSTQPHTLTNTTTNQNLQGIRCGAQSCVGRRRRRQRPGRLLVVLAPQSSSDRHHRLRRQRLRRLLEACCRATSTTSTSTSNDALRRAARPAAGKTGVCAWVCFARPCCHFAHPHSHPAQPPPHTPNRPGGQVMNEAIRTERVRLVVKDEATGERSMDRMTTRCASLPFSSPQPLNQPLTHHHPPPTQTHHQARARRRW